MTSRFRIRDHVTHVALPAPGGQAELCEWAADFYSHRLDRRRPLWEMALIDGLAEGRWAVAHKTHHCLVDGVGSVDVAYLLLDTEPNPPEREPASPPPRDNVSLLRPFVPTPPQPIADVAHAGARVARAGVHAALHPRESLERSRSLAELIVREEVIGAPHTSLNVPIGSTRRFAVVSRPLAELKTIRKAARRVDQRRGARRLHHRSAEPAPRAWRGTSTPRPACDGPDEPPPELRAADARQPGQLPVRRAPSRHRGCRTSVIDASSPRRHG